MNETHLRQAWQASGSGVALPTLEDARTGADRFHRLIRRRNRIEYAACALVVVFFGYGALFGMKDAITQAGAGLVVLGVCFVAWQLHSRASAVEPPAAETAQPILVHQRRQLARQRDALSRVGLWYLLPMLPGLALMLLAPVVRHGPGALGFGLGFAIAVNVAVFGGIWWLNHRIARKLQKAIDDLDALIAEQ